MKEGNSKEENSIVDLTTDSTSSMSSIQTGEWMSPSTELYTTRFKRCNLATDHCNQCSKYLPNYKNLSDHQFKDLLMKGIADKHRPEVEQVLSNYFMLRFIRKHAELMCYVSQLKLERAYWYFVLQLLDMPIGNWLSEIPKAMLNKNSLNWDRMKTKINIQHRQANSKRLLKSAQGKLRDHSKEQQLFPRPFDRRSSQDRLLLVIYTGLHVLVENSLYYFRLNFQQKRILLESDLIQASLVKSFHDLNPSAEQVFIYFFAILLLTPRNIDHSYILVGNCSNDLEEKIQIVPTSYCSKKAKSFHLSQIYTDGCQDGL